MKILYTNISPITKAYTNINHIYYLKKQNPDKVYLCIWDNFVLENNIFYSESNREEKLKENAEFLEKLMKHLKIDYKIIYLSEAWSRLFRNKDLSRLFQKIISSITLEQIKEGFSLHYIPFGDIDLSRVNYIIADYLIAINLPDLFPEICDSQPTHYLTSERFKVFQNNINHILKSSLIKYYPSKIIFVTKVPVILHPEKKVIPSLEMSYESVKNIVKAHYDQTPEKKEITDLIEVFSNVLPALIFKGKEISKTKVDNLFLARNYEDFIDFISANLYEYFEKVNRITSNIKLEKQKKHHFISKYHDFHNLVKSLNNIKLEILKHCNGNNSSVDISRKTGLHLSTVSTYITHFKRKKLVDNAKKPRRLVDSFVIDLEVMEQ